MQLEKKTNQQWVHTIPKLDTSSEPRILLSIRHIKTYIKEETETIIGKGDEYQTTNYPFITSHDDLNKYTEEIKNKIELLTLKAQNRLDDIRNNYI